MSGGSQQNGMKLGGTGGGGSGMQSANPNRQAGMNQIMSNFAANGGSQMRNNTTIQGSGGGNGHNGGGGGGGGGLFNGGGGDTGSQTTSSGPWGPAQGPLKDIMRTAGNYFDKDKGFKAYGSKPGQQPWTDFSSQTTNALGTMQDLASNPNPFYQGASGFTNSLINGGQNLDQSGYQNLMGNNPNAIARYGTGVANGTQNQNAISQYGTGIASGAQGINTEADYRSMLGNSDADFNSVVRNTENDLGDQIQRQFGGASYGAAQNADYLTKGVGDVSAKMRSDNYFNNQNLKQGLLNNITGVQGQNINNRMNAAGMLSGEQGQNINNRMNAAGMLSGEQQNAFSNNRGLLGDMSNLSQQDIANRQSGVGMADSVYNSQYLPSQMMGQVGNTYDTKNQQILDAKMNKFNTNQMSDWDRLAQYFGIASGTGAQGQRATTSTSQPSDPWSRLLGGGLLASQIF